MSPISFWAVFAVPWVLISILHQPVHSWQFSDAPPIEGARKGVTPPEFAPKQWRVNTTNLLTIFMPVIPTEMELGYAQNQLRTFERLFDLSTIREWMIVTPPDHVEDVKAFFRSEDLLRDLPHFNASMFRVVHDGECAPELMPGTTYSETPQQWKGWIRQQLVKLACASLMHTPFYLIMDSDVFVARPMGALNLFETGPCTAESVVCDADGEKSFKCANDCYPTSQAQEFHKNWWRNSAETLQLTFPLEWDAALGVTPQILSTDISLGLGKFIQERFGVEQWGAFLLDAYAAKHIKNWEERQFLGHDPAWTEYSIYFIFAQHARAFERYHSVGKILQWNAIWEQDQWEKWDACKDTFEWDWGYLGLVQSRLKLPPEAIWAKMKACWDMIDARPSPPPPPIPPPPVLVYEEPQSPPPPPEKPKVDPDASLGVSQPYKREGSTLTELLAAKRNVSGNATAKAAPAALSVNRHGTGGKGKGRGDLMRAVGRAPSLTIIMEQHLLQLITGGALALELLHAERANGSTPSRAGAKTPLEPSDRLHYEKPQLQHARPASNASAASNSSSRNSAAEQVAASEPELLQKLLGQQDAELLKTKAGPIANRASGSKSHDASQETLPSSSKSASSNKLPAAGSAAGSKSNETRAVSDPDTALQTSIALSAGGKQANAVLAEENEEPSKAPGGKKPGLLAGISENLRAAGSARGSKAADAAAAGKAGSKAAKAKAKLRPPPSERASAARMKRAEARRQNQARRLEAARHRQSSS